MAMTSIQKSSTKNQIDQCESVSHLIRFKVPSIENISYDYDSDCGMNVVGTVAMAMTRPLTLPFCWGYVSG